MPITRIRSVSGWGTSFETSDTVSKACQIFCGLFFFITGSGGAQVREPALPVTVHVVVSQTRAANVSKTATSNAQDASNVVVWFTPLDRSEPAAAVSLSPQNPPQLVQRNKTFEPHVLIVPVGTVVEFPNKDPFFHNIFSLYDGRRFDLGLYEAGTKRSVRFDRPGVSFLFCNIHAEMSAIVVSVDTPYFGLSDRNGNITVRDVPDGQYQMTVWYERSSPEHLKGLTRVISIANSSRKIGPIEVLENPTFTPTHKNKYGLDYVPPPNPDYDRP
jgi:plastocyanin